MKFEDRTDDAEEDDTITANKMPQHMTQVKLTTSSPHDSIEEDRENRIRFVQKGFVMNRSDASTRHEIAGADINRLCYDAIEEITSVEAAVSQSLTSQIGAIEILENRVKTDVRIAL